MTENRTIPYRMFENRTIRTGCLGVLLLIVTPIWAAPVLHTTAQGRYRVGWSCAAVCVVHVEDAQGQPVANLDIALAVRTFGHGQAPRPKVTAYLGQGDYRVEGLGRSLGGHWILGFRLGRGTEADSVAFEAEELP